MHHCTTIIYMHLCCVNDNLHKQNFGINMPVQPFVMKHMIFLEIIEFDLHNVSDNMFSSYCKQKRSATMQNFCCFFSF